MSITGVTGRAGAGAGVECADEEEAEVAVAVEVSCGDEDGREPAAVRQKEGSSGRDSKT